MDSRAGSFAVAFAGIYLFSAAEAVPAADYKRQDKPSLPAESASVVSYTVFATGLAGPRGLLFGPSGELYVVEQSGGRIARVGVDGRVTRVAEGFSDPHDVAIDAQGYLYVADSAENRVARISPAGAVTTYIGVVEFPVDLDFNPQGELLVCELHRGRVAAFKDRRMVRVIASGLQWPHGLAFGKSGETYIAENMGRRIVKVRPDGKLEPFAQIDGAVGIVLGRSGDLYVAQRRAGKFSRIKPDGTRITLLEGLKDPRDPAFDAAGNLYLAETGADRILKLSGDY